SDSVGTERALARRSAVRPPSQPHDACPDRGAEPQAHGEQQDLVTAVVAEPRQLARDQQREQQAAERAQPAPAPMRAIDPRSPGAGPLTAPARHICRPCAETWI